MSVLRRLTLALIILITCPVVVIACLWDYDTLKMERQRFPSALELITGKFLRHSDEFYQWRIKDRLAKLEADPGNLALYDDLAVAYDKTRQQDLAIETILKKDRLKPGLYETEANLGTFLIHSGKLEEGLVHIDKAIEINPDAHFGREKYQKLLVEYILSRRDVEPGFPLAEYDWYEESREVGGLTNFCDFLKTKLSLQQDQYLSQSDREAALNGILGIMKFGNFDSPIVLEVLGDLLLNDVDRNDDAKQLATRAYLKAARETKSVEGKERYRAIAVAALRMQTSSREQQMEMSQLEGQFQTELDEATTWYRSLHDQERQWIREGKNADQEFDRLYDSEPRVQVAAAYERRGRLSYNALIMIFGVMFIGITIGVTVTTVFAFRYWRGRQARQITKVVTPLPRT